MLLWMSLDGGAWQPRVLCQCDDVVWHVSWSLCASMLACSSGDNKVAPNHTLNSTVVVVQCSSCD